MGKQSQQLMTGLTYEQRVNKAKKRGYIRRAKSILFSFVKKPKYYANVRRHGNALINPKHLSRD